MTTDLLDRYRHEIEGAYDRRTPRSHALLQSARESIAGGVTRATNWWRPHPIFVDRAEGCRLFDVDGNEYLDWNGCFTAALLGNSPQRVLAAMREAPTRVLSAGAPTESVHVWARMLGERYPSVATLRFCCSGSEAVLFACRAARAWTGRPKVLKQRGSYHGTTDAMEVDMPTSQRGIPPHAGTDMLYADFWDEGEVEALLRVHRDELAGLLLNPIWFRRDDGRLLRLVEMSRANDVPVICDEVMSFRFAPGGAQQYFGFEADITAFGKSIGGGGLAVGAFGGRAEIMRLFSNLDAESPVHHSGTFAGNPTTAAAGIAALEELTPTLFERMAGLGERLRLGFGDAFAEAGVRVTLLGEASLVLLFLGELASLDPRAHASPPEQAEVKRLFGLSLLNKGMFTPADALIWAVSAPMRAADVDRAVTAVRATLAEFKPLFEASAPELLAG